MKMKSLSIQRIAHLLLIVVILAYILVVGKDFFIPIAFGICFALLLNPVCDGLEYYLNSRPLSIVISMFLIILPILSLVWLFGVQLLAIFADAGDLVDGVFTGLERVIRWGNDTLGLGIRNPGKWTEEQAELLLAEPSTLLTSSISSTSLIIGNVLLAIIYAFFFLLYRTAVSNFIYGQADHSIRDEISRIFGQIEFVIQRYLYGLVLVMMILGILNSLGLWFIGVDYPFFFGFLAACLAVIPYVGTTLGGMLPFIYAFATYDTIVTPLLVIVLYVSVQSLEGNFITPKVVGGNVNINPLAAIIAVILGGYVWGIPGLILALPLVAVLKITLDSIEITQPIGLLLGADVYDRSNDFLTIYNQDRHRIARLFMRGKEREKLVDNITYTVGGEVATDSPPEPTD